MYENAVPVFEMKNRLSYYLHKVDEGQKVFISVRGKPTYQIQTIEEVEKLTAEKPKGKSLFERIQESRAKYGLENDDFEEDLTDYFDSLRDHDYQGPADSEHLFDGV